MIRRSLLPLLAAAALLAGCDGKRAASVPLPREITADSVAEFCGMSLQEHPGPKAQLFVKGRAAPYWFGSVRDMFAFTLMPEEPKDVVAIYVSDMGRVRNWNHPEPGSWIEARKAWFVIGSRLRGGMDAAEAVPFGDRGQAEAFIGRNGGRLVRYAQMPRDYILPYNG